MSAPNNRPGLASIATANPHYILKQDDVLQAAKKIFAKHPMMSSRLDTIFANTGIKQRHSVCPIDWFFEKRGWRERNDAFITGAEALFREVTEKALEKAGLKPSQIDAIVTVSSTGIATPTLEARVMSGLGFKPQTRRIPVFGLGCAGGISGLSIATEIAASRPDANVLLVVIELCTLAFRKDDMSKSAIIASALFGDGAAALVLSGRAKNPLCQIEASGEHTWPDTLQIMGWDIDNLGMAAIFDRSIPQFARENMADAANGFLAANGLSQDDVDRYIFHPGGTRVLQALEETFDLGDDTLQAERQVLAKNGNMSAPTALFVLEKYIAGGLGKRNLIAALGPGFSCSFASLVT